MRAKGCNKSMFETLVAGIKKRLSMSKFARSRRWGRKILWVGPVAPVDGDSVACCKAGVEESRKNGLEAFTLPTIAMYKQIEWILTRDDMHPATHSFCSPALTTNDLQACYDALLKVWRPDEIVLVDGRTDRLGFDPRGVPIYEIDHHVDKGTRDDEGGYVQLAPSAGCHLIKKYGIYNSILVVSVLTDTFWLRQNMPSEAIESLALLRKHGDLDDQKLIEIQQKLRVPGDPRVIDAIRQSQMRRTETSVFIVLKDSDPELHRSVCGELGYFFAHLCVVRGDGYVSFRTTDQGLDLSKMARDHWHGGGHRNMSAGRLESMSPVELEELYEDFIATISGRPVATASC